MGSNEEPLLLLPPPIRNVLSLLSLACNMSCEWGESDESRDSLSHSQIVLQAVKATKEHFSMGEEGAGICRES